MITAERLRRCRSGEDAFALLRELGYEVAPIAIAAAGWRRAGISRGAMMSRSMSPRVKRDRDNDGVTILTLKETQMPE